MSRGRNCTKNSFQSYLEFRVLALDASDYRWHVERRSQLIVSFNGNTPFCGGGLNVIYEGGLCINESKISVSLSPIRVNLSCTDNDTNQLCGKHELYK